ncbi:putative uncharacterized protein [Vibrio anguillarum]|nr:putative uncharacterized protein [Vibrio anguillarum]
MRAYWQQYDHTYSNKEIIIIAKLLTLSRLWLTI